MLIWANKIFWQVETNMSFNTFIKMILKSYFHITSVTAEEYVEIINKLTGFASMYFIIFV